ncbi:hypothetical protein AMTRI_Chr12g240400 [Amborella trichopoda]
MHFGVKEDSFIRIRWSLLPRRITNMPQYNYKFTNWAFLSSYSKCLGTFANSVIHTCIEHMYHIIPYYLKSNTSPQISKRIVPKFHFEKG